VALDRQGDPALELWVAGSVVVDGAYAAEMRRKVEQVGAEKRVHFLGSIPYRDMLGYYRGAVAFVFPSRIETFGHPLLEAMLAGAPILASDIPAFREIAEGVALFFPQDDPDALVRAIDATRAAPEAAQARVALGRERAAEFSWSRSVDALCAVFRDALAPR
jgi:glycosyltransferase involved in cell wall biosynthesis